MKNKAELEKRFKEIEVEMIFFSKQRESNFDRIQELKAEMIYFEERIERLFEEGRKLIKELSKIKK